MPHKRSFLFLQGPQSGFFRKLGLKLSDLGYKVIKVNFCGGDVIHWPGRYTLSYRGSRSSWPGWVKDIFLKEKITDLLLFGDRRPMHRDAVLLAEQSGIRVYVFEEGYLRPAHITMEKGGVNGLSSLPRTPEKVRAMAEKMASLPVPRPLKNPLKKRVTDAILHHAGNAVFRPLYPRYRTHRPYTIAWELKGWIPRYLTRKKRNIQATALQDLIVDNDLKYFIFPLQLDSDFQIRLYSDFSSLTEAIMHVLKSFANHAPGDCCLVVKNHPLDNGLINYRAFVTCFARALGIGQRVHFIDGGDGGLLLKKSKGVVLINSTMGLEALCLGLPVYCLGQAIYAMPGLAVTEQDMSLDRFWSEPRSCAPDLLADFKKVLLHKALVFGNFYTPDGIRAAVEGTLSKLGVF